MTLKVPRVAFVEKTSEKGQIPSTTVYVNKIAIYTTPNSAASLSRGGDVFPSIPISTMNESRSPHYVTYSSENGRI